MKQNYRKIKTLLKILFLFAIKLEKRDKIEKPTVIIMKHKQTTIMCVRMNVYRNRKREVHLNVHVMCTTTNAEAAVFTV